MGLRPGVYHLVVYNQQCVPIGMDLIEEVVQVIQGTQVHSLLALRKARVHQIGLCRKVLELSEEPYARAADRGDNQIIHHVLRLGVVILEAHVATTCSVSTRSIVNNCHVFTFALVVVTDNIVLGIVQRSLQMWKITGHGTMLMRTSSGGGCMIQSQRQAHQINQDSGPRV